MSAVAIERGLTPMAKNTGLAKDAGDAPGAVVLSATITPGRLSSATTTSGRPSPLISVNSTSSGVSTPAIVDGAAKLGGAPTAPLLSSTDTEPPSPLAIA